MKVPSDCPPWIAEYLDSLRFDVETAMFKATDPLETARQVAKLGLLRELIEEIELRAATELEDQKKRVSELFDKRTDA